MTLWAAMNERNLSSLTCLLMLLINLLPPCACGICPAVCDFFVAMRGSFYPALVISLYIPHHNNLRGNVLQVALASIEFMLVDGLVTFCRSLIYRRDYWGLVPQCHHLDSSVYPLHPQLCHDCVHKLPVQLHPNGVNG